MNYNAHDNIVLVAPRPVRLAAPTPYTQFHTSLVQRPQARAAVRLVSAPADALDRLKLGEDVPEEESKNDSTPPSDRDSVSPRPSPRSSLPSEALEEFLSILRPTTFFFPPTSPVLRASNANAANLYFPYRRSTSCSVSPALPSDGLGLTLLDHLLDQCDDGEKENESIYPFKFLGSGHLASPVARNLTRNPFQRHPSYDAAVSALLRPNSMSPSPMGGAHSPAAVPLPPPTPEETEQEIIS